MSNYFGTLFAIGETAWTQGLAHFPHPGGKWLWPNGMRNDEYGIDGSTAILTNRKPRKGLELARDIWRLKTQVAEYGGWVASTE
jgi:hypothetical protein